MKPPCFYSTRIPCFLLHQNSSGRFDLWAALHISIVRLFAALQCTRSQARVLRVYFPQLGKMPSGSIPGSTSPPQLPSVTTGESASVESPKGAALVPVAERGGQALPLLRLLVRR